MLLFLSMSGMNTAKRQAGQLTKPRGGGGCLPSVFPQLDDGITAANAQQAGVDAHQR
jgi:hypothetical protein